MKIINYKRLEDCNDGSRKFEVVLECRTDENFFKKFVNSGQLIIEDKYDKPFYKIDKRGKFAIKGFLNDNIIKIYLNSEEEKIEHYLNLIRNS